MAELDQQDHCEGSHVHPASTPYYEDISLSEWLAHTPSRLANEHIGTGEEFLRKIDKTETVITPE